VAGRYEGRQGVVIPNIGPEPLEPSESDDIPRGGNAAMVYRDDAPTDDVQAASTRASAVTHRFGGVRYALSRPSATEPRPTSDEDG
jgi:hypothetical protein